MDSNLKIGNEGSGLYVGNSPVLGGGANAC